MPRVEESMASVWIGLDVAKDMVVMAVDAGRTLLLDKEQLISAADQAGIAIVGVAPEDPR